jgi:hypothetical protein
MEQKKLNLNNTDAAAWSSKPRQPGARSSPVAEGTATPALLAASWARLPAQLLRLIVTFVPTPTWTNLLVACRDYSAVTLSDATLRAAFVSRFDVGDADTPGMQNLGWAARLHRRGDIEDRFCFGEPQFAFIRCGSTTLGADFDPDLQQFLRLTQNNSVDLRAFQITSAETGDRLFPCGPMAGTVDHPRLFSERGKRFFVAAGSLGDCLRVFDEEGKGVRTIKLPSPPGHLFDCDPEQDLLAWASPDGNSVLLWRLSTGEPLPAPPKPRRQPCPVLRVCCRTRTVLRTTSDWKAGVYDLITGQELHVLKPAPELLTLCQRRVSRALCAVQAVDESITGPRLRLSFWDAQRGEMLRQWYWFMQPTERLVACSDRLVIACSPGYPGRLHLMHTRKGA